MQLLGCREIRLFTQVPFETLDAVVPDAFDVLPFATIVTGSVLITVLDCVRSLDNSTTFGSTMFYAAYVFVVPKNETWREEGYADYYILDLAASNAALATALRNQSTPALEANFTSVRTPRVADASAETWIVDSGSWKTAFEFVHVPDPTPQDLAFQGHLWYGEGPYGRVSHQLAHTGDSLPCAGLLAAVGTSQLATAMVSPAWPYLCDSSRDADNLFEFDGMWTP